jgi:hypothetical protein
LLKNGLHCRNESDSPEVTDTVSVIAEIIGKSARKMFRTFSLLKLSPEIQMAIRNEGSEW